LNRDVYTRSSSSWKWPPWEKKVSKERVRNKKGEIKGSIHISGGGLNRKEEGGSGGGKGLGKDRRQKATMEGSPQQGEQSSGLEEGEGGKKLVLKIEEGERPLPRGVRARERSRGSRSPGRKSPNINEREGDAGGEGSSSGLLEKGKGIG